MSWRAVMTLLGVVVLLGVAYWFVAAPVGARLAAEDGGEAAADSLAIGSAPEAVGASRRQVLAGALQPLEIAPRRSTATAAVAAGDELAGELVLRFADGAAWEAFRQAELPFGVTVVSELSRLRAVRLEWQGEAAYEALRQQFPNARGESNGTVFAPEVPRRSTEPGVAQPAGFGMSGLEFVGVKTDNASWGSGVTVAILDTGIEPHPVLGGTKVKRLDLLAEDAPREGPYAGHGTAVATIIAGVDPLVRGVAPGSELLDVRVLDGDGVGDAFAVAQGIVAAVDAGADVINLSLGSHSGAGIMKDAVDYAVAAGVTLVAAVGNEGSDAVLYPAAFDNVIAVAPIDANGQRPAFGNTGEAVDVAAPGTEVLSGWSDEQHVLFSGSSAAAPFVAGAVAAGMSELSEPVTDWEALLGWTSNDVGAAGRDPAHGEGILNVSRLLGSQTPGTRDAAIASHLIDAAAAGEIGAEEIPITIVVENRGTQPDTLVLDVEMAGERFAYEFADLAPGESAAAGLAVDGGELARTGGFDLKSSVRLDGQDANPEDNAKVSRLVPTPSEEAE